MCGVSLHQHWREDSCIPAPGKDWKWNIRTANCSSASDVLQLAGIVHNVTGSPIQWMSISLSINQMSGLQAAGSESVVAVPQSMACAPLTATSPSMAGLTFAPGNVKASFLTSLSAARVCNKVTEWKPLLNDDKRKWKLSFSEEFQDDFAQNESSSKRFCGNSGPLPSHTINVGFPTTVRESLSLTTVDIKLFKCKPSVNEGKRKWESAVCEDQLASKKFCGSDKGYISVK